MTGRASFAGPDEKAEGRPRESINTAAGPPPRGDGMLVHVLRGPGIGFNTQLRIGNPRRSRNPPSPATHPASPTLHAQGAWTSARERSGILMRAVSKSKLQIGGVEAERTPRSTEVKCSAESSTSGPGRPRPDPSLSWPITGRAAGEE